MAARTTVTEVKNIIDVGEGEDALSDSVVQTYINTATAYIDKVFVGVAVDDDYLEVLEKWVTAHFLATTRLQQAQTAGAGPARITFQGTTEMGLRSTHYGQTAIALDVTGRLAKAALIVSEPDKATSIEMMAITDSDEGVSY